jgi:VanZ family protein
MFTFTLAAFTVLFLLPQEFLANEVFDWWDKAQHAMAFAVLSATGIWSHTTKAKALFVFLLAYGASIEIVQSWTGWRQGDWQDWVADSVGVLMFFAGRSIAYRLTGSR